MSREFMNPWIFRSLDACLQELERLQLPTLRPLNATTEWCNATFDEVMCWPATPGGQRYSLPCPPMQGLNPNKIVKKLCHISGRWANRNGTADYEGTHGWTGYIDMCLLVDPRTMSAEHSCWATFTSGFLYPILLVVLLALLVVAVVIGSIYLGRRCSKMKKFRTLLVRQQVPVEPSQVATASGGKESKII